MVGFRNHIHNPCIITLEPQTIIPIIYGFDTAYFQSARSSPPCRPSIPDFRYEWILKDDILAAVSGVPDFDLVVTSGINS